MPEASPDHLRLAGFALAHAVWSIEDGETLCTMAMLDVGEERRLALFEASSMLKRGRVGLLGKPLALGAFPGDAPDIVLAGAVEHEKVRDLFQAAS